MSIVRSDARLEQHPKPTQAFERKLAGSTYVDWPNTTEINAAYNIAYRPNKYFWIAGAYFQCEDDGVTYRLVSAPGAQVQWFTIGYESNFFDTGITDTIQLVIRGASGAPEIVTDTSPVGTQILNSSGVLYASSDNLWTPTEQIAVLYGATVGASPVTEIITPQVLTPGTSVAWDYSLGLNATLEIDQNSELEFSNVVDGAVLSLLITQSGAFDIDVPVTDKMSFTNRSGNTIILPHTAGAQVIITCQTFGTVRYWNYGGFV